MANQEYLFGVNEEELHRLEFQHKVWRGVTDPFIRKLQIQPDWDIVDIGAGPGFVTKDLSEYIPEGSITAIEPAGYYAERIAKLNINNSLVINDTFENADLKRDHYDLTFMRWVFTFVKDPHYFVKKLNSVLKTGGILAIQDYYYEGLSLYPNTGPFNKMAEYVREYYKSEKGDPYIGASLLKHLRQTGFEITEFYPVVLSGNPESGIMQWADKFFVKHIYFMADKGIYDKNTADMLFEDWQSHMNDNDSVFVSPIVFNIIAKKVSQETI